MTTEAIKAAILAEMADFKTSLLEAQIKVLHNFTERLDVAVEEVKVQITGAK